MATVDPKGAWNPGAAVALTAEQTLSPGADPVADVVRVERQFLPYAPPISAANTFVIKSGSGLIGEITVQGGTMGLVTIYDSPTATGTVLLALTPAALTQGLVLLRDIVFNNGLTIVTAAATVITVSYR